MMYFTPDEKALREEGQRLVDMYAPETEPHKLGRIILRYISQRQKMLKTIRHLARMMRDNKELSSSIAYKDAISVLNNADKDQIMDSPGITSNQVG